MRTLNFANRNFKEIIRDPLSLIFAILLPLFLLFIFQQFKIPSEVYQLENFTPGIIIFGFSFITLFTATLIAKDRSTSLLIRLGTSPMKPIEYILGYTLAVIPMVIIQNILFFIVAILLGLTFSINVIYTILITIPISVLFIALGIFIGCITNEKSASGVSSVVVQLVAFTSGMYFSADMVGDFFAKLCNILPFSRCVDITKGILNNNYDKLGENCLILIVYIAVVVFISMLIFRKKMVSDNK
ncbi:MAG: ABC transporter permease [Clostridia bacterium]|nr:ABC transporter permease [Clostridia bacterium]